VRRMKIGCEILTYNSMDYLPRIVEQCRGVFDHVAFVHHETPWNGRRTYSDNTVRALREICGDGSEGFDLIEAQGRPSPSEQFSRNVGVEYLGMTRECDWIFIMDDDEIYSVGALEYLLAQLRAKQLQGIEAFGLAGDCIRTLWGDDRHEISPRPTHWPVIAVRPWVRFIDCRCIPMNIRTGIVSLPHGMTMDHYSWLHNEDHMRDKLQAYGHAKEIPDRWLEDVWKAKATASVGSKTGKPIMFSNVVAIHD